MAVPLAGAGGIGRIRFLGFDFLGALFWSAAYATVGYFFSNQLERVAIHIERIGVLVSLIATAAFGFYLARKFARWERFLREFRLTRITPEQLRDKLDKGEDVLILDLQSRAGSRCGIVSHPRRDSHGPPQTRAIQRCRDRPFPAGGPLLCLSR